MEYQVYQKNSNARLRERETSKEGIKGYVEREKEKKEHTVSREVMHLKSGKGEIAVGVNRKGEVTLVISSDKEGELKEDRKEVHMDTAKYHKLKGGHFYTNTHKEQKSALVYKEKVEKQPALLMKRMKQALKEKENEPAKEVVPFFPQTEQGVEEEKRWKKEEQYLEKNLEKTREKLQKMMKKLQLEEEGIQFLLVKEEELEKKEGEGEEDTKS